jgi:hypothetical protein
MGQPWVSLGAATAPLRAIQGSQGYMANAWGNAANAFSKGWDQGVQKKRVAENDAFNRDQRMQASARAAEALDLNRKRFEQQREQAAQAAEARKARMEMERKRFDFDMQSAERRRQAEDEKKATYGRIADLQAEGKTQDAALEALRTGDPRLYAQIDDRAVARQQRELNTARTAYSIISSAKTPEEFDAALAVLEKAGADVSAYKGGGLRAQRQAQADMRREMAKAEAAQKRMQWMLKRRQMQQGDRKLDLEGRKLDMEQARLEANGGQDFSKLPAFAANASSFASRMVQAEQNVRRLMNPELKDQRFDPTGMRTRAGNAIEYVLGEEAANTVARSTQGQQYRQAAEQWIRAFLRKESGAAISDSEFERDFAVYFPQPGDTPEVIQQKEAARQNAMRNMVGETRGFFAHNNPEQAKQLQMWSQGTQRPPQPPPGQPAPQQAQPPAQSAGGPPPPGTRFRNPQTGEIILWDGQRYINATPPSNTAVPTPTGL